MRRAVRWWMVAAVMAALMPLEAVADDGTADAEAEETVVREDDKLVYEKKTRVDFNDAEVDGDLQHPDGEVVRTGPKAKFKSMIQQRRDFNQELLESIDE